MLGIIKYTNENICQGFFGGLVKKYCFTGTGDLRRQARLNVKRGGKSTFDALDSLREADTGIPLKE